MAKILNKTGARGMDKEKVVYFSVMASNDDENDADSDEEKGEEMVRLSMEETVSDSIGGFIETSRTRRSKKQSLNEIKKQRALTEMVYPRFKIRWISFLLNEAISSPNGFS